MRRWVRLAAIVIAVPLVLAGLATTYVKRELAEPEAFADRAVDALRSREVRVVIAEELAVEMLERASPNLVASRPLVLAAVEALIETDEFGRVLRRAAIAAHAALLRGDRDVIVELEQANDVLLPAIRNASPEIARQIPADLSPQIAEIRRTDIATGVVRTAEGADAAAVPLLVAAALAIGLGVALAPNRRRAVATVGPILAAGGALGLIMLAGLRAQVVSRTEAVGVLSQDDTRAAAGAAWDALAGGLEDWLAVMAVTGLAIGAAGLLAEARIDRRAALRHTAEILAGGRLPRAVRLARGLVLAALGALILLGAEPVFAVAVIGLGGVLVLLGLAEALSTVGGPHGWQRPRLPRRRRAIAATGLAALAAVAIAIRLVTAGGPVSPPRAEEIEECNGLRVLCERRLDQVALAGTHNSMSAADRPGWFFSNQIRPIPQQLADGIRLLMIDPHYGIVDARGRVRTDLQAEGTSRNRVARRLGPDAVRVAEQLVGSLGLAPIEGERELFLCHTLCELGAERLNSTLDEIRGFLERNRSEVVVLFTESSVDPEDLEREFERADLLPYLAELRRGRPLPTLGAMVGSGRRLVVLDQGDGGPAPWYHPGFVFTKDTRIRSLLASRTACDPNRGSPESPLFLMNHWIDRFPPPVDENREVGSAETLLERVRSCRRIRGRAPNLIAVDFYGGSEVIDAVRELNLSGALLDG